MTAFVLKVRRKLPPEEGPSEVHVYDGERQLWVEKESGAPLITRMRGQARPSPFGETPITETLEGADATEIATLHASPFGETVLTKTFEGVDQSEISPIHASPFGETTITSTIEGVDQSEIDSGEVGILDAPYSHF